MTSRTNTKGRIPRRVYAPIRHRRLRDWLMPLSCQEIQTPFSYENRLKSPTLLREEPDFFAADINVRGRYAEYAVVQNKSITNFNAKGTDNFRPDLLAAFVAKEMKRLAEPTLTFLIRMNADARVSPAEIHEGLTKLLRSEQRPVWLHGFERNEPTNNRFLQYVFPGYDESKKFDYRIGTFVPPDEPEVLRYMQYVETLANNN